MEEVLRKGRGVIGYLHQPGQDGIGIDLKHPRHGADAQACSQCTHSPHQYVRGHTLAMERGAVGFEEVALADRARQLPPGTSARMPCTIREERRVQLRVE